MDVDELELDIVVAHAPPMKYLPKILNGGIAGIIGVSCVFPLDLIKTRLQNQKTKTYNGIFDCFYKTISAAGSSPVARARALYQGASVNVLLITPEKAIKLVANDVFRHVFKSDGERLSRFRGMLAGCCAGFCQIVVTTPMELIKINMQQSTKRSSALALVLKLLGEDGIRGLYRGLGPTMARDVTFSGIYFPLFAELDALGPRKKDESGDAVFWASFVSGLAAGALASFMVTPLDVVKTRCQIAAANNKCSSNNTVPRVMLSILRKEGPQALFKGALCRMMVMAPLFGIAQAIYYIGLAEKLLGREKLR